MAQRAPKRATRTTALSPADRPSSSTGTSAASWWQFRRQAFVVALVAIAASLAGLRNDFVFDDVPQVAENVRVQDLSRVGEILTSSYWPPPFAQELYRPVASLTVAIQYVVGAGSPIVFRVCSYLLYALVSIGVLRLARRVLPERIALGVALLFAAHPLHVEAVALAVNQGELIVAGAAVLCVSRYVDRRRSGDGQLSPRDWLFIGAWSVVGALAKENGFVIPGLIVASEVLIAGDLRGRLASLWRGYAALAMSACALLVVRAAVLAGSVTGALPAKAIAGVGLGGRLLTMLQIVPRWLRLLAWPAHLQMDYSPNEIVASTGFGATEALGLAFLIGGALIIWLSRKRAPAITFGLLWCAVALFPVSNIVPTGIVLAERTLFLPSVGFVIAVGGAVAFVIERFATTTALADRAFTAACMVLVALGVVRSDARHLTWRNGQTMWEAAAIDAPRSLRVKQAHDEAVADLTRDFEAMAARSPEPWRVQFQLATLLRAMRADSAALVHLQASVADHPEQNDARLELAATLASVGRYDEAKRVARELNVAGDSAAVAARISTLADSASAAAIPAGAIRIVAREELVARAR
jgi:hypothetical protein